MTALPLQDFIIQSSRKNVKFQTITALFGDGYMQRAGDGINQKREMWALIWDNLDQTQRDILWVFIDEVKMSDVIEWTAPGDLTEKKWIIDPEGDVTEQAKAGDIYTVGFTLRRMFDL